MYFSLNTQSYLHILFQENFMDRKKGYLSVILNSVTWAVLHRGKALSLDETSFIFSPGPQPVRS